MKDTSYAVIERIEFDLPWQWPPASVQPFMKDGKLDDNAIAQGVKSLTKRAWRRPLTENEDKELDALIDSYSEGWRTDRMPAVDRARLRMAVFELVHRTDVPTEAVLTEVVELASDYSTERSGRFVNGVVSRIAEEHRPAPDEE